ncbi:MAG: Dabb family protein [Myxococcales bacterium]
MLTHVVLMKFKPENQRSNLERARELLLDMRGRVECLRSIEVGLNCVPSERAFELALITRFDDLAGLNEYADHPVHVEVKRFLAGVLEKSHVVDYQSE